MGLGSGLQGHTAFEFRQSIFKGTERVFAMSCRLNSVCFMGLVFQENSEP